ncbi:hypothetical protein NQZ68_031521 [Dissostichus eleginoides]|nr:hypothetical protein NQZ68_031521 [Dissostichus eleginoides]
MYAPFSGHRTKHKGQRAGPHQPVPLMAPCTYALPQTPLWWVKVEPECITWSPQISLSEFSIESWPAIRPDPEKVRRPLSSPGSGSATTDECGARPVTMAAKCGEVITFWGKH